MRLLSKYLGEDLEKFFPREDVLVADDDENTDDENAPKAEAKPLFAFKRLPTPAEILKAFNQAVRLAPDHAPYWQAKGDALRDGLDESNADSSEVDNKKDDRPFQILESYRRAADLKPENAASLWYLLYGMYIA